MKATHAMAKSHARVEASMAKLSTGSRINSARDDAAGLAISTRMTAQSIGLAQSADNASSAISMIKTADEAMSRVVDLLQRMRALSLESANGALSVTDRGYLNQEYQQLKNEIDRIGTETEWNGMSLFDGVTLPGTTQFQIGPNVNQTIGVEMGTLATRTLSELPIAQTGSDILGATRFENFASSISISADGSTLAVAANSGGASGDGQVRIYNNTPSGWTQLGSDIDGESMYGTNSVVSISGDGSTVAVGSRKLGTSDATGNGNVRVYTFDDQSFSWIQVGSELEGDIQYSTFGGAVSLSNDGTVFAVSSRLL